MSVASTEYGVTRRLSSGGIVQIYMKSTDELNFAEADINGIALSHNIAGLGQEPDQPANNAGNWTSTSDAPFPGQGTYVSALEVKSGTKSCTTLSTTTQTVRLLAQTFIPIYDNSAGLWDDVAASNVVGGDSFIVATDAQIKAKTNELKACTLVAQATDSVTYYQPQLMSSDYYCVGSDGDAGVAKIYIAWNTGTTYF